MPVLNWIGKDKIINHDKELPFRVLKPNNKLSYGEESDNLLIRGDNLEALKALMPFYFNKVKLVYIDPPYNTGSEKWVYNDKVNAPQIKQWLNKVVGSEGEDLCRHDKWLCMMYPRIKLLRDLLKADGAIFISIDDNEQHHLRKMLDEIFGEKNFIGNIIWQKKYAASNDNKTVSELHEYVIAYAKDITQWKPNLFERPAELNAKYTNPDDDPRGAWYSTNLSVKTFSEKNYYEITGPTGKKFLPPPSRCWVVSKEKYQSLLDDGRIWFGKTGESRPYLKTYLTEVQQGIVPTSLWLHQDAGHTIGAKSDLRDIFQGQTELFDTPKPTKLIKRVIQLSSSDGDIVLDSFAGSGTTGQAVLELNKENNINRRFILVELEKNIAEKITTHRLRSTIDGYKKAVFEQGTGQGFQYIDLNGELFDQNGFINSDAEYEDLASYIYYSETKKYAELEDIKAPFVGRVAKTSYYLLFREKGKNVLDDKFFDEIKNIKGTKVIFADKCLIDDEDLAKYNVIFKQIPYELKKF